MENKKLTLIVENIPINLVNTSGYVRYKERVAYALKNKDRPEYQKPICVDSEYRLIFGEERFFIDQSEGKENIQCYKIDLGDILSGKYSPKYLAKILTIIERTQLGIALESFIETNNIDIDDYVKGK